MAPSLENRSERTRTAILRAFVVIVFEKGFDNVSVQGIVSAAEIARSTFYEHFSSKEDVLRASIGPLFTVLAESVSADGQPPQLSDVLSHFWENRRLTDAIFAPSPRRILALSLSELVEARLRGRFGGKELLVPYRLAAIHIAEAQLALVESWLRGRAFSRASDVAAALHQSSRASAAALLHVV